MYSARTKPGDEQVRLEGDSLARLARLKGRLANRPGKCRPHGLWRQGYSKVGCRQVQSCLSGLTRIAAPFRELKKLCEPHIKREDEGKFRCSSCSKLFKAEAFVEKHIANKHPEITRDVDDVSYPSLVGPVR